VANPTDEANARVGDISFSGDILPLLQDNCGMCHSTMGKGDLDVTSYEALVQGGANGPAFVPGSPDESQLVKTMQEEHFRKLEEPDLQKLIVWIAAGAENN
jgi:hypothetical protein